MEPVLYASLVSAPKPKLSVIIPAFNEENRLPPTLEILRSWIPKSRFDVEIIVVDDGSSDRTAEVVEKAIATLPGLRLQRNPHVGFMHAITTGFGLSQRPYKASLEADCPVHPSMFDRFFDDLHQFDIVMGSRMLKGDGASLEGKSFFRRILSSGMSYLFVILFKGGVRDPQIGFKLYKGEVLDRVLPLLRADHDGMKSAEVLVKAQSLGYRVKEHPVHYRHDEDSRCVPKGNYRVVVEAAFAVFRLWFKSFSEYKNGTLPSNPVRFSFLISLFVSEHALKNKKGAL